MDGENVTTPAGELWRMYEAAAEHMPVEFLLDRLMAVTSNERLAALTPEQRLQGLTPEQILDALPREVCESFAWRLRGRSQRRAAVVRDLDLADRCFREVMTHIAETMPIEILLRRSATLPSEHQLAGLTPQQRISGLTAGEILLALPVETCEHLAEKLCP